MLLLNHRSLRLARLLRRNRAPRNDGLGGVFNRATKIRSALTRGLVGISLLAAVGGCSPSRDDGATLGPQVHRDEVRFGLSFEERMTIPPRLSRLRAEALRRADEVYDPFRSREEATRNDEYQARLIAEARATLLAEKRLSEDDLQAIVAEYQASLGANLRR